MVVLFGKCYSYDEVCFKVIFQWVWICKLFSVVDKATITASIENVAVSTKSIEKINGCLSTAESNMVCSIKEFSHFLLSWYIVHWLDHLYRLKRQYLCSPSIPNSYICQRYLIYSCYFIYRLYHKIIKGLQNIFHLFASNDLNVLDLSPNS